MRRGAAQAARQYWVIGGEYSDTSFRELDAGRAETLGPFDSYDAALSIWRERSNATRPMGCVRYTIAVNTSA